MRRTRFIRKVAMVTASAVMTAAALMAAPTMASADDSDTVTSSEVAAALSTTEAGNGNLVAEPVKSLADTDSAAVVTKNGSITDVPKDPEDGVSLGIEGASPITIGLPNADEAGNAKRLPDGTVVYPGTDGSAQAVIPTATGAQMLTTIANADAPTRFTYNVDVPDGGKVVLTEDGGAVVLGSDDVPALVIPTAWAKDANGAAVPTHFETDGSSLTQVVDHTTGNYAYPVAADPNFWAYVGCIAGTGIPIGAAIAMAMVPQTWPILIATAARLGAAPATATNWAARVIGWCGAALRR
ncbi:hypothetical protein [Streptomyces sp. GQFP]|uniref:hypothetical protein n=1 Tax=Streptomyces sp. GQFP TaxID=2907545 RepID=UPI001F4375C6|nr:hypothetical protein [Streptomyces sp. GQFP]UIX33353.1 hypothetical protein LUX31_26940 [Streptomyces sp. GQFP]